MTTRTDTERLDWLERAKLTDPQTTVIWPTELGWHRTEGGGATYKTMREAIDAAMDAAESEDLDKAWKWFAQQDDARLVWHETIPEWRVHQGEPRSGLNWKGGAGSRNGAVLAAYRASLVKK